MSCYITSCFCAPCRWIENCCWCDPVDQANKLYEESAKIKKVSVAASPTFTSSVPSQGSPSSPTLAPSHHERTRTWRWTNGKLGYVLPEPVFGPEKKIVIEEKKV